MSPSVTESGISRVAKEEQPEKAAGPMDLTDWGSIKLLNEAQSWKRLCAISVRELEINTFLRLEHSCKAPVPTWFTELGIVKLSNALQREKAYAPMEVTESGIVKLVKEQQPWKEFF